MCSSDLSLDDHLAATNRTTNVRSSAGMYSSARYGLGNSGGSSGVGESSLGRPSARTLVSTESTADDNTRTNDDYHLGTAARTNTNAGLPEYHSDSSGDDAYLTNNGREGGGERHASQMELFEEDHGDEMEPDLMVEDDDDGHGGHDSYGGAARPASRGGSSSSANPSPLAGFIGGMFGGGQHLQAGRSSRNDDGPPVTMTGRASLLSNLPGFGGGAATTTTNAIRSRSSSMHSLGSSGGNSRASQQSSLNSLNYGPVVFEAPLNDTEEYDVYKEEPKAYSKGRQRMKRRGNRPSGGAGSASSASGGSGDEYGSGSGSGTSGDEYGVGGGNATSGSESGEDYLQAAADATNDMLRKKRRGGLKKAGSSSSSIGSDLGEAATMATAAAHRQHRQEQFQQQQQEEASTGAGAGAGAGGDASGSHLDRHLAAGGAAADDDAGADGVERMDSRSADNRSTNSAGLYTYGDMYDTDGSSYGGGGSHRSPYDGEDESEYSTSPDREGGMRHVAGHDGADGTTLSSLMGRQAAATGGDGADASSSARSFGSNLPITRVKQ